MQKNAAAPAPAPLRIMKIYCTIVQEQIIFLWSLSDLSSETGFGKPPDDDDGFILSLEENTIA
jgi:hypothetical protein